MSNGEVFHTKAILYPLIAPIISMIALVSFLQLSTAILFISGIGIFCYFSIKNHEKHHREEQYDDRLTTERMTEALEYIVKRGEKKK